MNDRIVFNGLRACCMEDAENENSSKTHREVLQSSLQLMLKVRAGMSVVFAKRTLKGD